MKPYFIETSVIVDLMRGKKQAIELLNALEGELTSSYICYGELYEGVYRVTNKKQRETALIKFFSSLFTVFTVEEQVARTFGKLRAYLKQKGNVIEDLDLLIAATCLVYNLELVTFNKKHFTHVPGLSIFSINVN